MHGCVSWRDEGCYLQDGTKDLLLHHCIFHARILNQSWRHKAIANVNFAAGHDGAGAALYHLFHTLHVTLVDDPAILVGSSVLAFKVVDMDGIRIKLLQHYLSQSIESSTTTLHCRYFRVAFFSSSSSSSSSFIFTFSPLPKCDQSPSPHALASGHLFHFSVESKLTVPPAVIN